MPWTLGTLFHFWGPCFDFLEPFFDLLGLFWDKRDRKKLGGTFLAMDDFLHVPASRTNAFCIFMGCIGNGESNVLRRI